MILKGLFVSNFLLICSIIHSRHVEPQWHLCFPDTVSSTGSFTQHFIVNLGVGAEGEKSIESICKPTTYFISLEFLKSLQFSFNLTLKITYGLRKEGRQILHKAKNRVFQSLYFFLRCVFMLLCTDGRGGK